MTGILQMQCKSFGKEKDFMIVLQIFIDFSLNWK